MHVWVSVGKYMQERRHSSDVLKGGGGGQGGEGGDQEGGSRERRGDKKRRRWKRSGDMMKNIQGRRGKHSWFFVSKIDCLWYEFDQENDAMFEKKTIRNIRLDENNENCGPQLFCSYVRIEIVCDSSPEWTKDNKIINMIRKVYEPVEKGAREICW